jgi:two-component system OmpR family response regulator
VWGSSAELEQNNIDVLIKSLRAHIDDPFEEKLIQTVRGVGYRLASRSVA